jgi:rod shape determining protein RodA
VSGTLVGVPAAPRTLLARAGALHWGLILAVSAVAGVGFALLYSAAGGDFKPWADKQMLRFGVGFALMLAVALIRLKFWLRMAYPLYVAVLLMLIAVMLFGKTALGAARWIDLGIVQLQPSELMKVALVLALARYFHRAEFERIGRPWLLIVPAIMVFAPAILVMRQPDLGTATVLIAVGGAVFFLAGVRVWKFAVLIVGGLVAAPFAWNALHGYQKQRITTFLDPEVDPLGAGYHIIQSKIALGSGGFFGKGFLQGTQIRLNFLPEFHTDFIFSVLAEEFGMLGGLVLLALYALILIAILGIAWRARSQFGRLLAMGVGTILFLHLAINMGMVMGALPVVGVPLPLVSFGGTSMWSLMIGFGLVLSAAVYRDEKLGRFDDAD